MYCPCDDTLSILSFMESHACWSLAESRAAVVKEEVSRPHDLNLNVVDVLSVIPHDRERIPWEGEFTIC